MNVRERVSARRARRNASHRPSPLLPGQAPPGRLAGESLPAPSLVARRSSPPPAKPTTTRPPTRIDGRPPPLPRRPPPRPRPGPTTLRPPVDSRRRRRRFTFSGGSRRVVPRVAPGRARGVSRAARGRRASRRRRGRCRGTTRAGGRPRARFSQRAGPVGSRRRGFPDPAQPRRDPRRPARRFPAARDWRVHSRTIHPPRLDATTRLVPDPTRASDRRRRARGRRIFPPPPPRCVGPGRSSTRSTPRSTRRGGDRPARRARGNLSADVRPSRSSASRRCRIESPLG